jgi:hypothetical protein
MTRGLVTVLTLISTVLFPWPFTALLALSLSLTEPLVPLAAGILADTLYYAPHAGSAPLFTLCGAAATGIGFLVRSRLKTSIIG